jgi:hypothetical protein
VAYQPWACLRCCLVFLQALVFASQPLSKFMGARNNGVTGCPLHFRTQNADVTAASSASVKFHINIQGGYKIYKQCKVMRCVLNVEGDIAASNPSRLVRLVHILQGKPHYSLCRKLGSTGASFVGSRPDSCVRSRKMSGRAFSV